GLSSRQPLTNLCRCPAGKRVICWQMKIWANDLFPSRSLCEVEPTQRTLVQAARFATERAQAQRVNRGFEPLDSRFRARAKDSIHLQRQTVKVSESQKV